MKRKILIFFATLALTIAFSSPGYSSRGHGHFRHGGHVNFGFVIGPGWSPWWGGYPYSPYYPYYPYYYPYNPGPPVVIEQQPETYIQQGAPEEEPHYWYFCKEPEGYYPYVKKCPKGWLKVLPDPTPEGEEE